MGSGGWLLQQAANAQESTVYRARLFDEVHRLVAERYVEEMDSAELYRMAIDGMLAELGDPYSVFIGADQTDDLEHQCLGVEHAGQLAANFNHHLLAQLGPLPLGDVGDYG